MLQAMATSEQWPIDKFVFYARNPYFRKGSALYGARNFCSFRW